MTECLEIQVCSRSNPEKWVKKSRYNEESCVLLLNVNTEQTNLDYKDSRGKGGKGDRMGMLSKYGDWKDKETGTFGNGLGEIRKPEFLNLL